MKDNLNNNDIMTSQERSHRMSLIKSKDTKPEMKVRSLLFSMGYRYRLHNVKLPGNPDIEFKSKRCLIFVNGCFWHAHKKCRLNRPPKSNNIYWDTKLRTNVARDKRNIIRLKRMGWSVLVIWECELADIDRVKKILIDFLESN